MKTLNELTDAELNEAFAVEVAGWKRCRSPFQSKSDPSSRGWDDPKCYGRKELPKWSTSADAVMPWLDATKHWGNLYLGNNHRIEIEHRFSGTGPTFARAACIALIEQKRREKQ